MADLEQRLSKVCAALKKEVEETKKAISEKEKRRRDLQRRRTEALGATPVNHELVAQLTASIEEIDRDLEFERPQLEAAIQDLQANCHGF